MFHDNSRYFSVCTVFLCHKLIQKNIDMRNRTHDQMHIYNEILTKKIDLIIIDKVQLFHQIT